MIQEILTSTGTAALSFVNQIPWKELAGAFFGAASAFHLERKSKKSDEKKKEQALLFAFYALASVKINWLDNIEKQVIAQLVKPKTLNIGLLPPASVTESLSPLIGDASGLNLIRDFFVADQSLHIFYTEFQRRNELLANTLGGLRPPDRLDELRTVELRMVAANEHIVEMLKLATVQLYAACSALASSFKEKYPGQSLGEIRRVGPR